MRPLLGLVGLLFLVTSCGHLPSHVHVPALAAGDPGWRATLAAHTRTPIMDGNDVQILLNGDEIFPAMLAAIRSARRSITYAQFAYKDGPIAEELAAALAGRCRDGVAAHVLIDAFGARWVPTRVRDLLRHAGCQFVDDFRPLSVRTLGRANYRNHRRLLVVDGRIGFTGGSGVGPRWTGNGIGENHFRETDVRVEGPVVRQLQDAFAENWFEATGVLLGGDAYYPPLAPAGDVAAHAVRSAPVDGNSTMYTLFLLAIASARESIHITNQYLVLDEALMAALVGAARRGVGVRVIVPGRPTNRFAHAAGRRDIGRLVRTGVALHEYRAGLLHAKTMVVDGRWATVGSTNLDPRSFALNDELNLAVYDRTIAGGLDAVFAGDLGRSRPVTYRDWQETPLGLRLLGLLLEPIRNQL